jgi:hypothetical protein
VTEDDMAELMAPYDLLARGATGGPPSESLGYALSSRAGRLAALAILVLAVAPIAFVMSQVIGPAGLVGAGAVVVGIVSAFRVRVARAAERR